MNQRQNILSSIREGVVDSLPIAVSYVPFGAIFGMLALKTGLAAWQAVAMSLVVYSGAAQFTAISMIGEQATVWAIVLAASLLNGRHLLMGLSLAPHYQAFTAGQLNGLAFFLTDEKYAIALNRLRLKPCNPAYVFAVSLTLYVSWCGGTWIGTVAGQALPDPEALGLGFAFTAMFLALSYDQLKSLLRVAVFLACGALSVWLSLLLPAGLPLVAAGLLAFFVGYFTAGRKHEAEEKPVREVETA